MQKKPKTFTQKMIHHRDIHSSNLEAVTVGTIRQGLFLGHPPCRSPDAAALLPSMHLQLLSDKLKWAELSLKCAATARGPLITAPANGNGRNVSRCYIQMERQKPI